MSKIHIVLGMSLLGMLSSNAAMAADSSEIVSGAIGGAAGAAIGQSMGGQSGAVAGAALGGALGVMLAESNESQPAPVVIQPVHVEHVAPVEHDDFRRVNFRERERSDHNRD